ncbi:cytochrome d ubiquinol oxidase subunit II [Salmonella enterica subsp. enterica]|nr:cytochrome d ubiquinol oxidase subunit II [Salmonella enterica subsp. enterica]
MTIDLPVIWFACQSFATLMYITVMDGFDLGKPHPVSLIAINTIAMLAVTVAPVWGRGTKPLVLGAGPAFGAFPAGLCRHHRRAGLSRWWLCCLVLSSRRRAFEFRFATESHARSDKLPYRRSIPGDLPVGLWRARRWVRFSVGRANLSGPRSFLTG